MAKLNETLYLGLDVGGTRIKAGLVSDVGQVLTATAVDSHAEGTREQVLADISLALEPFRDKSAIGLGAGFPSFGDYERGVLDSAKSAYPSLHRFPLRRHLEETYGIPTRLVPDANLLAYGLLRFGEGRYFDNFIAIGLGTGTAIGLVRHGEVLMGPRGFPDEIMRFYTDWGWPGAWKHSGYHFGDHYGTDPMTAYNRACQGDPAALCIWRRVGEELSHTIVRLTAETKTENAVIAGGLANAWGFIKTAVYPLVEPKGIQVVKTRLSHPSLSGAAALFSGPERE